MIKDIALICGYLTSIIALVAVLCKSLRTINAVRKGQLCLLRSEILSIYYKHDQDEEPTLRQYERENLDALAAAYKAEGGNSFVQDIYDVMRHWHVSA